MHLLKRSKGVTSPMQVHAVATRYAAAQLESSYHLCHLVTKSSAVDTVHQERGFPLMLVTVIYYLTSRSDNTIIRNVSYLHCMFSTLRFIDFFCSE